MTNWFQTHMVRTVFGWGPSKRMIVQGGVDTSSCNFVDGLRDLVNKARKERCIYVEIRCFEDYSAYRDAFEEAGFTYEPHYDVHIYPNRVVPEPKMRQIRKAQAEGLCWREANTEEDIKTWYSCLRKLYLWKIKRPLPGLNFFKDLIYNKDCKLLIVEAPLPSLGRRDALNGRLESSGCPKGGKGASIAGGVLLAVEEDKSKAYEWYICGQVMSTWAAIDWCKQHGVSCFDTMGAGRPGVPYGVRDFKLQMGGELKEFGRYRYVLRPWLYKLGCILMRK